MEDDSSSERDPETFSLELNASQLLALNTILQHESLYLADPAYSTYAKGIGREVIDLMASNEFSEAIDEEMDYLEEQYQSMQSPPTDEIPGRGVQ